jgi:hypothetical protein
VRSGVSSYEQLLRVAADHGEQVVEVVGDATGEAADRLQALCLPQLFLELFALGDVATDRLDAGRTAVFFDHPACHLDLDAAPVLGQQLVLVDGRLDIVVDFPIAGALELFVPFGWHELAKRAAGSSSRL